MNRVELGRRGEELAVGVLQQSGMTIIDRNWYCGEGELDIVAHESADDTLVFCEVKTRTGLGYGSPFEAITEVKLHRLRRLVGRWLAAHQVAARQVRIDAIGVLLTPGNPPTWRHIRGIDQ